ncbi:MAG: radical SAM protein [Planctomycetes bacterium]|nr:radical SAM protein [Planctomycetota bacterium]
MRIFLADLGHNLLTLSSDVYPLGVANLATYARAHAGIAEPLEISIFREPQDLKAALDAGAPDLLGLSNYAWNEELAYHFASYAKRRNASTLVAMGGPNYPLVDSVREQFLRGLPNVDVYVDGPTYEGERSFTNLVRRFAEVRRRIEGVREGALAGVDWIDRRSGAFVRGGEVERIKDLDEIPSPYLAGLMDPYIATGYFPMMQISRGCPFTCAFCNSGVRSNSRVFAHSFDNVKADLAYLAQRVKPEITLCFADDNFGMYERDEEIADYIGWLQDTYGWPRYIRTTTGKNKGERIIKVMRKIKGALPMTAAVQSMNPVVLKNIKRDNIKLETYREIQKELESFGMQSYGELILCLPGETKESFQKAVSDLLDAGAKRISAHQLMLLHGAELANPAERAKFGFDTRFRVVARNIGNYTGEPLIEVEEMVVATPQFSFADYLEMRVFHLLLTIFHYEGNYDEPFAFARQHGVKPFELVVHMQKVLARAPAAFRKVIDDFVAESQQEIFPTREACLAWARAHYPELVEGTLGGNLLSKYSMLGRFYTTHESLAYLRTAIESVLDERGANCDPRELDAVFEYMTNVVLHVPFAETSALKKTWRSRYDVEAWAEANYAQPLATFASAEPRSFQAECSAATRALILSKVATFGEHASGLGKFTRTMFARQLRRALDREHAAASA